MTRPFQGHIAIDIRDSVADWEPYAQPKAPAGAPNVLYIVLDDVGYSAMEPVGRLHRDAPTSSAWRRTASPTRTGIPRRCARPRAPRSSPAATTPPTGWPASPRRRPGSPAPTATSRSSARRSPRSWASGAGTPTCSASGTSAPRTSTAWRRRSATGPSAAAWSASTASSAARRTSGIPTSSTTTTTSTSPPAPRTATTSTTDLVDHAIQFIGDAKVVAPEKPFFMYFCPGATHAPHHAPKEWIDKYKGKFDMGYERYRELVFENQKSGSASCPPTRRCRRSTRTPRRRAPTASPGPPPTRSGHGTR